MKKILKIMVAVFIISFVLFNREVRAENLQIKQGVLDLQEQPLNDQVLKLEGEWEFYWGELLTPEDFSGQTPHKKDWIQAPSIWSMAEYTGTKALSNDGYGTYRLIIKINETNQNKPLSFYLPSVASAFQLFVDGELIAKNGVVGKDRNSMEPKSYSQIASFMPQANEIEVIMQVSNFYSRKGGMWSAVKFGSNQEISKLREMNVIREVIIASSLFAIGFYHISLWLFRATTALPLFLGVLCLGISLRTVLVGELLLIYLFPTFSWELSVKLEYLTIYLGIMIIFIFLAFLFPKEVNRKIVYVASIICLLFSLTTCFPANIFTHYRRPFEIFLVFMFIYYNYVLILATIRKREGGLISILSVILLALGILNDSFYYEQRINSIDLTPIAALTCLFVQTLIVAKKSSNAFKRVELLSKELHEVNSSLEQIVATRTKDLEKTNKELRYIEDTRKSFFSSVAHELGTPMQSIQGYIQLLQTKAPSKEQEKYLNIIFEKTKLLNHLSKDLLDLAKMDEGQYEFTFEQMNTIYLLDYLYQRYKYDIDKAGLNSVYTPPKHVPEGVTILINIDVFRFEQVMSNLINNAIKFTPTGGQIHVQAEIIYENSQEQGILLLEICDTGVGIDEELLPHIFDRFMKGENSLKQIKGSGLGLAICREIIKKHDGTISVKSELGKGSCFTIKLPVQLVKEDESLEFNNLNS
ncbi:sensor histidine kinase [Lysinibacillus sp. BW-2-10]|uniref:sensor histidine kinase n=2 Tax=Lysinibacillus TaxID=400634 RepID=UPI00117D01CD|nr:sensor histidine kinase [Lysinibacillus sp. BW-2-10]TSI06849.1 hypothetical protein FJQ64_09885 [Lysinibacillus sp. BW-2-10]